MSIETPTVLSRLDNIQALRGIAAILVVFCHIADHQRRYATPGSVEWEIASGFWDQGWIGVDLFFVISGFIMVYVTRDLAPSLRTSGEFLYKRVTRIYPVWWLCAGLIAIYFLISYGVPAGPDVVPDPRENWAWVGKSLLLWPQENVPSLGVGWTLIHEMFFYAVFAVLLLFARSKLVVGLLIWAGLTIAYNVAYGQVPNDRPFLMLSTALMSLEFIAGALVAYYLPRLKPNVSVFRLAWGGIGVSLIFLAWALVTNPDLAPGAQTNYISRTILYITPFTTIVGATTYLYQHGKLRVSQALVKLGDWSYALYLSHILVLMAITRVIRVAEPYLPEFLANLVVVDRAGWFNNVVMAGVALLACLIVAAAMYRWFERPVTRWFRRIGPGRLPVQTSVQSS